MKLYEIKEIELNLKLITRNTDNENVSKPDKHFLLPESSKGFHCIHFE